jgi:hypothetical protein
LIDEYIYGEDHPMARQYTGDVMHDNRRDWIFIDATFEGIV